LNNQTEAVLLPQATSIEKKTNEIVPALPEGFFDDPDLDAKIRGQSREANLEAEYEEFKKIIQTEEFKSDIIVEQDDKLRDYDRDIQEVDVLIERWNKIESLHQRREAIKQQQKLKKNNPDNMDVEEKQDDDGDDDDDEEIDIKDVMNMALRSKNMF
jgi:zinc finger protein 830